MEKIAELVKDKKIEGITEMRDESVLWDLAISRPVHSPMLSPLPLSALSSSPFHCALQDGFGQT